MTLSHSIFRGALGLAVVSALAFAVWAFGGPFFHHRGGEVGMYVGCALVFVLGSGWLLHPLLQGERSFLRFNRIFLAAFGTYAIIWSLAWFKLGFGKGEWLGSALGCLAFVAVCAASLGRWSQCFVAAAVLFACHSAGYFFGGQIYYPSDHGTLMKLAWGVVYGLGFGAGIGFTFWSLQRR